MVVDGGIGARHKLLEGCMGETVLAAEPPEHTWQLCFG